MNVLSGVSDFFGLDIGTTAIRLVELKGSAPNKVLAKYAYVPIEGNISLSDSKTDQKKLADAVAQLVEQARVSTKNVAVGIPSSKVFTTVADVDRMSDAELAKSIRYQVDALIPTPIAESKVDWALLGDSPTNKTKVEILLSSIANKWIEDRLDLLEGIGLNVIAFEPDQMAMTRALITPDLPGAQLVLDTGSRNTDLTVVYNGNPRLMRSIPTGTETIIRSAAQNLSVDEKQAEQFVMRFGLSQEKLEGQVAKAIIGVVDSLVAEIEKSIKFFMTRYSDTKIDKIVVTGGVSAIPEFPVLIANKFGVEVEIGNAWRNVSYSAERQNELAALSNHFSVAVGLAERAE